MRMSETSVDLVLLRGATPAEARDLSLDLRDLRKAARAAVKQWETADHIDGDYEWNIFCDCMKALRAQITEENQ